MQLEKFDYHEEKVIQEINNKDVKLGRLLHK